MRRGRARTTCWRELRGGAKALPRSWDPQFRGSSKSMGTSWFNNFSFRYLSSSIFPVFQLLSLELFAVLDCTVPHRDLSPTRAIGLVTMPMPSSSNGKQQKPSLYFYEKKCFLVFPSTIQYYKRTRTFSQPFPVKPTKPNVWVKDPSLENDLLHARLWWLSDPERK